MRALPFTVYVISDLDAVADGAALLEAVGDILSAVGSRAAVQLRDKTRSPAERHALGIALRAQTRAHDALLFVNCPTGDLSLARSIDADGVHLPDGVLAAGLDGMLQGRSCHDAEGLRRAERDGALFATLSPVLSSPGKGRALGWPAFRTLALDARIPVVALGGMLPSESASARTHGAAAVAAIRGLLSVPSPGAAAREFVQSFGEAST